MKKTAILIFLICSVMLMQAGTTLYITVGERSEPAIMAENAATEKLKELLEKGSITILTHDYGGFEKVGELPQSLPATDSQITTVPGDIMLYLGDNIVFFYGSNTWSYTPIGRIEGMTAEELKDFLSADDGAITLSLSQTTSVKTVSTDRDHEVYDLSGTRVSTGGRSVNELPSGCYIKEGRKIIVR